MSVFLGALLMALPAWAEPTPTLALSLDSVQKAALERSPKLRAAEADRDAAQAQARGRLSTLWPRLALDASWRYASVIPTLQFPIRGAAPQEFGTHDAWALGPSLSWVFWDSGAAQSAWRSLSAAARSRGEDAAALKRQLLLEARLAYFQAQLGLEQVRLLADSLRLAQAQHADVAQRLKYRAASRMDLLSAHQEVLNRKRVLRQARSDVASSVRDLFAKTGFGAGSDPSLALDRATASKLPPDTEPPTLLLGLDVLEDSLKALDRGPEGGREHPRLKALSESAEASRQAARSAFAERWPRLQLTARSNAEYPNGPTVETIHQNAVGLSLSLPLFEGWRVTEEIGRRKTEALAFEERRAQAAIDLGRDLLQADDQLAGLRVQREINRQAVLETEELARLTYESYQGGRSTFLEVQTANLQALEAKVQSARTDARILAQLAVRRSLSSED
ncbi:MAG TPA: hypothetical protein DCM05_10040 [Elusimicrobia bacterium]|nr:hypothetical protein [Elusimicrobiota bacterium]